ncbi:MAG: hypothetical protein LBE20_04810 [Deltaproteobacteria bacterium]|jgi:hypothetical protein|nr:hypothetical protein [Deltaproteobacteria bacterium]
MNLSNKTITLILTISICFNIFCLGFIVANNLAIPTPKHFAGQKYTKHSSKADLDFHRRFNDVDFAKHKKLDIQAQTEQITKLRKKIATLLTESEVDVDQVRQLLDEIKTNEDLIRSKFEKNFLDKVLKMNQNERQEFVKKMAKKMPFQQHHK